MRTHHPAAGGKGTNNTWPSTAITVPLEVCTRPRLLGRLTRHRAEGLNGLYADAAERLGGLDRALVDAGQRVTLLDRCYGRSEIAQQAVVDSIDPAALSSQTRSSGAANSTAAAAKASGMHA